MELFKLLLESPKFLKGKLKMPRGVFRIASHKYFEPAFAMLILVNSFTIAGEAQFKGWQVAMRRDQDLDWGLTITRIY
eukprot:4204531-Amphidinium_carterae.1